MSEKNTKNNNDDTTENQKTKIKKQKKEKDDFVQMGVSLLNNINFKIAFFLLLIGMIIFSDLFINGIIGKFQDTIHGECTTTKGTILQLTLLVISYIVIDLLDKADII